MNSNYVKPMTSLCVS